MFDADLAPEKIESLHVVNQGIEVKVLEISAGRRCTARRVGTIGASNRLFSSCELPIKAAYVVRKKAAAMACAEFQIGKAVPRFEFRVNPKPGT